MTNQAAMLAPLTKVSRLHHQASGFDQARDADFEADFKAGLECDREVDRAGARHSKLMLSNSRSQALESKPLNSKPRALEIYSN
jgi:hypothetical protein